MTCVHFTTDVGECGAPAKGRYLTGLKCNQHTPAALAGHPDPDPAASSPPQSPGRVRLVYGAAGLDPLGREGEGWHISPQTRLPVRDKADAG